MKRFLRKLWKDEEGAELVEWIIVVAVLIGTAVAGYVLLANAIFDGAEDVADLIGENLNDGE